jgi:hypothetical protein
MLFLILFLAIFFASTASAALVAFSTSASSTSEPTKVTVMVTTTITAIPITTPTPLQLATAWPDVHARQEWQPSVPAWSEPAPAWSEPAVWSEPANTWAPAPTIATFYSYTDVATATPTPTYSWDETHRPAINGLSTVKMIAIGVGVVGGILFIVFTYMLIRRYLYRRQPTRPQSPNSTNRDSDVEMLPRSTQYQPTSRVPSSHSVIGRDDGFRATLAQGHPYIPTATQHQIPCRPVPAHGPALPHQPTHWPTGEVEQPAQQNVTWMRGPGYRRME